MRIRFLFRYFVTWILIFVTQKIVFMLFNMGLADGAPFWSCVASLWHGLRLDITTACYLSILPTLVVLVNYFFKRFPLRRVLCPYYWLAAFVVAVIFIVDTVLYFFWRAKFDANDLIYAAKPKELFANLPVWASIAAVLVLGTLSFHYYRRQRHATPKTLEAVRSPLYALVVIPLAGLIFLGMRGGVTQSTANPSYAYFSPHSFCNHAALNPTFNVMHSLFKVQDLDKEFDKYSESELQSILGDAYMPDNAITDTLLSLERPNVLLIIWEGGGLGMVGSDSVAPNLHRLKQEGLYFDRCFANSFRTDRGLVSTLSGWLGLPTLSLMKRTDLCRCLPSMASSLRDEGYSTSITYGGDIDFTNMRLYFSETGFSHVRGSQHFPASMHTSAWGVHDHHLLTPALVPDERPFFSTALTLSSHEPWEVPMQRLEDPKLNSFAYTDSCIGALVDQLKATPLWDSLLVVVIPDHGIVFGDHHYTLDTAVTHIPMLWLGGALARTGVVHKLMNQSDLAATLMAQMGIDTKPFRFSRNVFSPSYDGRKSFAVHADKNCLTLIQPAHVGSFDCVSRQLNIDNDEDRVFIEALLQRLYQTTASLPKEASVRD
ncbi:MAG: sulfatase-like hydrolase/transferase [Bacteroidales bacterium]|nr:sulfatase-like hydrolase/transferase [Bacteroidales bacterium]